VNCERTSASSGRTPPAYAKTVDFLEIRALATEKVKHWREQLWAEKEKLDSLHVGRENSWIDTSLTGLRRPICLRRPVCVKCRRYRVAEGCKPSGATGRASALAMRELLRHAGFDPGSFEEVGVHSAPELDRVGEDEVTEVLRRY